MKLWEQAYEREQGAPATMEAKNSSTTYAALQTRHKLAASQLQELQARQAKSVVAAAMPIARFANDDLKQRWLPGVISGDTILSTAHPYQGLQNRAPLSARACGDGWELSGHSNLVGYASLAQGFVVSAQLDDGGHWVGFVAADSAGLSITAQRATNGEACGHLYFDGVSVTPGNLIATHSEAETLLQWQRQHTFAAMAALQLGVLQEGLQRAAQYTTERTQFGRPLAAFQAVSQQAVAGSGSWCLWSRKSCHCRPASRRVYR